jgi:hypothetical protein
MDKILSTILQGRIATYLSLVHRKIPELYYSQPGGPPFNNTQFLEAFQGAFMAFVVSQNPNDKIAPTVTPPWELYSEANTEMVFNKTFDNKTNVHVNSIDNSQLSRCK